MQQDECTFSFDTPLSPGCLLTNLATHRSVGVDFIDMERRLCAKHGDPSSLYPVSYTHLTLPTILLV